MPIIHLGWPWELGPELPPLPDGYVFLTDDWGAYLTDDDGNFLIVEKAENG